MLTWHSTFVHYGNGIHQHYLQKRSDWVLILRPLQNSILYIYIYVCMLCYAKSLQSCPTLCDPIDGSPPGFPVPGILQARTLEWVAIFFSSAWKWKVKVKSLSRVRLLVTPWTAAYQAPLSMEFSRQEYWSGVPLPSLICMYVCVCVYISIYVCV